jgi:hypothetical protein
MILTSKKNLYWNADYSPTQYQELKARVRSMEDIVAVDRT